MRRFMFNTFKFGGVTFASYGPFDSVESAEHWGANMSATYFALHNVSAVECSCPLFDSGELGEEQAIQRIMECPTHGTQSPDLPEFYD